MKLDSYEQFFEIVSKEKLFKFGLDNIISIDAEHAKNLWDELKTNVAQNTNSKLFIRSSGRDGKGNDLLKAMYKDVLGIDIEIDSTNNTKPTQLLERNTGYRENKSIFNYQVSHVFGLTKNVFCFTAPWNIVFIPKLIDPFTGHEAKGEYVEEFQIQFQKYIYSKYKELIDDYNCLIRSKYPEIKSYLEKHAEPKKLKDYLKDFQEIKILEKSETIPLKEKNVCYLDNKKLSGMKGKRIACNVNYNGTQESYSSMNRTVLEVIKNICKKSQYTENELRAVFPDCVAKNVESGYSGFKTVFIDEKQANDHDFFTKDIIHLKDKVIAISKQWNASNFRNFKQVVKKHFNIDIYEV